MEFVYSIRFDLEQKRSVISIVPRKYWEENRCLSDRMNGDERKEADDIFRSVGILISEISEGEFVALEDNPEITGLPSFEEMMYMSNDEFDALPSYRELDLEEAQDLASKLSGNQMVYSKRLEDFLG